MSLKLDAITEKLVASPPTVYLHLQEALKDEDSSFENYAGIISGDPALAARLLKIVNSPFYGMQSKIETITHALNIIGTSELSELALATSVVTKFFGLPPDLVNLNDFWLHSIAVGVAARLIAQHKRASNPERYYVAGMLHDIGRLAILKEEPFKSQEVLKQYYKKETKSFLEVEKEILGFTHEDVGGVILREWKVPSSLVEAVFDHHRPFDAKQYKAEAAIVHVADYMAYEMGLGNSGEPTVPPLNPKALSSLKITEAFIRETRDKVRGDTERAVEIFL